MTTVGLRLNYTKFLSWHLSKECARIFCDIIAAIFVLHICDEKYVDIQKMEDQREKLEELIESQFGLLEKLLKMHAITRNQLERIKCEHIRVNINKIMLDYIFQEKKHNDLITALSESSQSHVVNWIKSRGEYSEEFDFDWPLTEGQQEILDANLEQLIDSIDNCELISMLYSGHVINKRQRDVLRSKATDHEKNEALLGMARRLSQRSFQTLINCLRKSNQIHIADILENGGALVPVHVTLESDNLDETEAQIVNALTNLLVQENVSQEQSSRLLAATQLNIIAIRRGQSLVLYSWCRREDELDRLCKIIDDLKIKDVLEKLFNVLIYNIRIKILSVKILESDATKARQLLKTLPHIFDESLEKIDEHGAAAPGVTKLKNEFFCLNKDGETKVFYDRYPFVPQQKFQLKEIKIAEDIVSSEKENALCILVVHWGPHICVWKIEQNSKINQKETKFLKFSIDFQPETLSMSKCDQLLMASWSPSPSLRIYGLDAQLRLLASLHQYIQRPIHAVDTSTGNFVICIY